MEISMIFGGVAVAFNVIVILIKLQNGRILNAGLDTAFLCTVTMVLSGSFAGLMVGTYASLAFSTFLWVRPPKFSSEKTILFENVKKKCIEEFRKKREEQLRQR